MTRHTTVGEHMTPSPHTIAKDEALDRATELMRRHRIRHLPVLDGRSLCGILSIRDVHLIQTFDDVDPSKVTVEEAMTPEPYGVAPDTPLREVVETMLEHKYGTAVVTDGLEVVGIFTTVDALRALADRL